MEETGHPFPLALTVTRVGNLFTTHTPVEAGFDRFSEDLMRSHFHFYAENRLHLPFDELMALGRRDPGDSHEPFNMAYLAIRGSGAVNGVSRLHGAVSRRLFQSLFPQWPIEEVPISHVTNGVHVPTWDSAEADRLWTDVCGKRCWRTGMEEIKTPLRRIEDTAIWRMRTEARTSLIEYVRQRYARQVAGQGGSADEIVAAGQVFDFNILTLGFARRFATYKRPNLLLHDPERLRRILSNPQHPVQLVLAGKAHPQDGAGQAMIRQWSEFIQRSGTPSRVIFLSDYDMLLTERLVGGVDVWLNTPRRPWEASGTSGMKVLVNGGLNLSELDGWWAEAYSPDVGWAIGDGNEHGEDPAWDAAEAEALYGLLEREIVPEFYNRDARSMPVKWVARMRESMARLTPAFSANRTVREYTEQHYLPAATGYTDRVAEKGKLGTELLAWQTKLRELWGDLRFGAVKAELRDGCLRCEVPVYFGRLDPGAVRLELFANGLNGSEPVRKPMDQGPKLPDGGILYSACVEPGRNANDFTPRIVPYHAGASVPLEANQILWQK
jgi:starch phosphorylase